MPWENGVNWEPIDSENGILFLYVHSSTQVFSLRSRLPFIRRNLLALPGAPKKLTLRLEAHTETL
jgi:hypothetical protein